MTSNLAAIDKIRIREIRGVLETGIVMGDDNKRSGFGYGNGRKTITLRALKIAVFAPIPKARVKSAAEAKAGVLRNERTACRRSRINRSSGSKVL